MGKICSVVKPRQSPQLEYFQTAFHQQQMRDDVRLQNRIIIQRKKFILKIRKNFKKFCPKKFKIFSLKFCFKNCKILRLKISSRKTEKKEKILQSDI